MPSKFAEFELPKGASAIRTDKEGYAAMEQAGRRVGQLYGVAGSDYAAIGKLEDEAFRAQDFPLDFAAFRSGSTRGAGGGGGGGFKVSNPGAGFGGTTDGGGGGGRSTGAFPRSGRTPSQTGQTVASAAHLVGNWSGNTPTLLRGGQQPQGAPGQLMNPGAVVGGEIGQQQDPRFDIRPPNAGRPEDDAGQAPFGSEGNPNLGIGPNSNSFDQLMNQVDPNPPPIPSTGGIGQYFSDMWSSVTSAISSAGAAGIDSSAPTEGSY